MIYLDNSATTRVSDEAARAAVRCMTENYFNPSALYAPAMEAEKEMTLCREALLRAVHAPQGSRAVFVSGGTEADNLAILGSMQSLRSGVVLYSDGEHPAVREACQALRNVQARVLPLDRDGRVCLDRLPELFTGDVRLICVMQVNNETGAVMPIREIAALRDIHCPQALLHVDGVQGFLRVPFDMAHSGADSYALSGHKIHAPKGVGALILGPRFRLTARQIGGGQEKALRSGTENTPGIAALRAAVEHFPADTDLRAMKLRLWEGLHSLIPQAVVNGPDPASDLTAPHILNVSLPPVRSETMLHALEGDGICIGLGSACSSHKQRVSRVLSAMGISGLRAESALRFSLSPYNTPEEMDLTARAAQKYYDAFKAFVRR